MHSVVKAPQSRRPRGLGQSSRATVVLAWLAFWLNTAIFPCCQAFAANVSDPDGSISQSASYDHTSLDFDAAHPGQPDHSPFSPCGFFVSTIPATISQAAFLAADHTSWQSIVPPVTASSFPVALNVANSFTPREIPPPVRLYLRGLNLRL